MKPLIVFSDVTIDGFMAGPDNDLDFLVDDPQLDQPYRTRRPVKPGLQIAEHRKLSYPRPPALRKLDSENLC
jgi:hypothetical protein